MTVSTRTEAVCEITLEMVRRHDLAMGHKIVWGLVYAHKSISSIEIAELLDVSIDAATKYVADLVQRGLLTGARHDGVWYVSIE